MLKCYCIVYSADEADFSSLRLQAQWMLTCLFDGHWAYRVRMSSFLDCLRGSLVHRYRAARLAPRPPARKPGMGSGAPTCGLACSSGTFFEPPIISQVVVTVIYPDATLPRVDFLDSSQSE